MRKNAHALTHLGQTRTLEEWARVTRIPAPTIWSRLKLLGWPVARALSEPVKRQFAASGRPKIDLPRPCPPMREHAGGQAFSRWQSKGKRQSRYFGPWGSAEAKSAYKRFQIEWASGLSDSAPAAGLKLTVAKLAVLYSALAKQHYRKNGKLTSSYGAARRAMKVLTAAVRPGQPADDVTGADLKSCQATMVALGWKRRSVNNYANKIVAAFAWAAGETGLDRQPLVSPNVVAALRMVPAIQAGRTAAGESSPKLSAPWAGVEATFPHLDKRPARRAVLEAMIRFHWTAGMRPGEVVAIRPQDIDRTRAEWRYESVLVNKNLHRGKPQVYWLGPKAQAILLPLLADCPAGRPIFAIPPARASGRWRSLDRDAYRRIVGLACKRAGVPHWHPHQLRHSRATEVARIYEDDKAAAAAIGTTPQVASAIYVDPQEAVKRRIARETG